MFDFRVDVRAKRAYRELKLLMYLNHRDANVCINSFFFILLMNFSVINRSYNYTMFLHRILMLEVFGICKLNNSSMILKILFSWLDIWH